MKKHIFLIDDDIDEMKVFVAALKQLGEDFKCTYAANGIHALKMLHYLRPDMIFVDYDMPAMNGLDFIEEMNKNKELLHIPVFLYSTHISLSMLQKARDLGVTGCIEKVFALHDLMKALTPIVSAKRIAQPL